MRRFKNLHLYCRVCGQVRYNPVHLLFYAWDGLLEFVTEHNASHRVWAWVFVRSFTIDRWTHGVFVYEADVWDDRDPINFALYEDEL